MKRTGRRGMTGRRGHIILRIHRVVGMRIGNRRARMGSARVKIVPG